jgi:hypothetical protein
MPSAKPPPLGRVEPTGVAQTKDSATAIWQHRISGLDVPRVSRGIELARVALINNFGRFGEASPINGLQLS